jgi:hypothetical protein
LSAATSKPFPNFPQSGIGPLFSGLFFPAALLGDPAALLGDKRDLKGVDKFYSLDRK